MTGGFAPTKRQLQVLRVVAESIARRGISPTHREIGDELGITSTNGVHDHLACLERKGLLEKRGPRNMSRRLALTNHGVSFVGEVFPRRKLDLPQVPHITIGQSFCGQCGATTFAPSKPCVVCRVMREAAA